MIEIPESTTLSRQATETLKGKVITEVINATSLHRFTWYHGDPNAYSKLLVGKEIWAVKGYGSFVDLCLEDETHIVIGDGTSMKYYSEIDKTPTKFQLLIAFQDHSFLVFTVAMYGAIYAFKGELDNPYYQGSIQKRSPLNTAFDAPYFGHLIETLKKDISIKAFLATEQRFPGLGNGVLQDILFNAGIHPKRKLSTLSTKEKKNLFHSIRTTLSQMIEGGGRDTEKDLHGNWGHYKTRLSKNTYKNPCPACGTAIAKEAYLGGTIYYCPNCQRMI